MPHEINTEQPKDMMNSMASHDWVAQYNENMKGLGVIVRYRCTNCGTEWSSIIVSKADNEKQSEMGKKQSSEGGRKKASFKK